MRKEENGMLSRLSSSATAIRSSNYTIPRSYGSSLSSYRLSNYTPASRTSTYTEKREEPKHTPSYSSGSNTLRRSSSSTSYSRTLYQSPAAAKLNSSQNSTSIYSSSYKHAPSFHSTSSSSAYDSKHNSLNNNTSNINQNLCNGSGSITSNGYNTMTNNNQQAVPSSRIRSSSMAPSYRTVNVAQLNKQARERADREEKLKNYSEWLEREKQKEMDLSDDVLSKEFRSCLTSSNNNNNNNSPGYNQFRRSVTSKSELNGTNSLQQQNNGLKPVTGATAATSSSSVSTTSLYNTTHAKTAKDYVEDGRQNGSIISPLGYTGLRNIGNTCFLNATVQMLANIIELRTYFQKELYCIDINKTNDLGCQGRIAEAFAEIMKLLWNGKHRAIEPARLKELVALKAPQFSNCGQHDAHEFLSFLLDLLHEDLNRVLLKPYTNQIQCENDQDKQVSDEAWNNHLLRNNSIFVDLFHGQLKSKLQCPKCERISITFDPFVYLPVPFPKPKKLLKVVFWPLSTDRKPTNLQVRYSADGTIQDILNIIGDMVNVSSKLLKIIEVFGHRMQKIYNPSERASEICGGDIVYAFETEDPIEEIVELYVIQRLLYVPSLRYACHECGNSKGKLKACEACYNAYYCNKDCQLSHWNNGGHRDECRRRNQAESVGQPFMVSVPRSQLTYSNLIKLLEKKCKLSVNVTSLQTLDEGDYLNRSASDSSSHENKHGAPTLHHVTDKPKKREHKQFIVRTIPSQAHILGDTIIVDKSAESQILPLKSGAFISVNWYNFRYGKPFLTVETRKTLDCERESSVKRGTQCNGSEKDTTLEDMMEMFSETERLKPEESWYCNRCKDHVEATKKLELFRLPPVLIVQLKRFVYTTSYQAMHRRSKDERRVIYPLEGLDMSPYLSDTAPQLSTIYDLMGVVCHSGSSFFGHYVSMGRLAGFDSTSTEIEWRLFDDSIVTKLSPEAVQSDDAYLLFYKQRGNVTRPIFRKHYSCDPTEKSSSEEVNSQAL